jgi:hypothetical protein
LAADEYRQPSGAVADCHAPLQAASVAGHVLVLHPRGIVVPEADPVEVQKALFASWIGTVSPTRMELLVPSVTLAIVAICMVE